MSATIPASPGSVRRRGVDPSDRVGGDAHLRRLVGRIAAEDRNAFVELYDLTSPEVLTRLRAAMCPAVHVPAVVAGTYVEVWLLARFHTGDDADVRGWIMGVTVGRARDLCLSAARSRPEYTVDRSARSPFDVDTHTRNFLATLLGEAPDARHAR